MDYPERRREQAEHTHKAIRTAALKLMRARGFEAVSVRDICAEAGITTGAFYHHFPSKSALISDGFGAMDDYIEASMATHDGEPPAQWLWRLIEAYAQFMSEGGELIGRYYALRLAVPATQSMAPNRYAQEMMARCFSAAQEAGVLDKTHTPAWLAEFCYCHFRGLVLDWVLSGYTYPLLEKMREDYALFVKLFLA